MFNRLCFYLLLFVSIFFTISFLGVNAEEVEENQFKYTLSICSVFKDEAPYLREWIEYHKLLGVDHFYLYNNESTDDYLQVLEPYILSDEVTLTDWPSDPKDIELNRWVYTTQWSAMSDGIFRSIGVSKWLALIDIDEFILPLKEDSIPEFLANYEEFPGITISWQCFGTSKVHEIPEGKLLIETLIYKGPPMDECNVAYKSIVKPDRIDVTTPDWCPHSWRFLDERDYLVFSDGERCKFGKIVTDKIVINHYVHRTENYFWNVKIPKKKRMEGPKWKWRSMLKRYRDCNQIKDKNIFRFVPALREILFGEAL